ncbi:hypothetical protein CK203_041132 [Vitis vinifera]|uniref:Uncharacterized protein n=1 Tax=Vitis vinifera TaxID=29760 RepID=A0A438HT71_VITVI|nr:hypothetical protein CK203_041132 [Vitis vinifera]
MGSQQSRQPIAQDEMPHDSLSPPPPIPDQTVPQASPYLLHGQSEVVSPTAVHTTVHEDTLAPWIVSSSVLGS